MRLIIEADTDDLAVIALRALFYALDHDPYPGIEDWRWKPGAVIAARYAEKYWIVRTTKSGYSIREERKP